MKTIADLSKPYTKDHFEIISSVYEDYMLLKNFSKSTIKTYLYNFKTYHHWCTEESHEEIYTQDTVRAYLVYRVKKGAKWQTMNSIYSPLSTQDGQGYLCLTKTKKVAKTHKKTKRHSNKQRSLPRSTRNA